AVSDSKGGIYSEAGLEPDAVLEHKRESGSVVGFRDTEAISNEDLLELQVTVLWPAALENAITEENAGNIRAKIIAEAANGPTTPEADQILHQKGIFVIPDFLCNAGGVTVSYFEWVQNVCGYYWSLEEIQQRLDEKMTKAFHAVLEMQRQKGVHMRLAAYLVAVQRVAEAMRLRGWV
ncbi:MAG: Glu/Leu/Phe/Val dehydrogenase, partial [Candidatus Bipolaricaulia bacterium]